MLQQNDWTVIYRQGVSSLKIFSFRFDLKISSRTFYINNDQKIDGVVMLIAFNY